MKATVLGLVLYSSLTACTAEPAPKPSESFTTGQARPTEVASPEPTERGSAPTSRTATFSSTGFDVAFSFDYPATWTVEDTAPPNQDGGPFSILNEAGAEVASLYVQPQFSAYPCERICGDMAVSYLGDVPGHGKLGDKHYSVQTKAMDLTSRQDLQKTNSWKGNVRLILGVTGDSSTTTQAEDPVHFTTLGGIDVPSSSSPVRPIFFGANRYFATMTEAKAYTSSSEHAQIQTMMQSLNATAVTAAGRGTPTPTTTPTGLR